MRVKKNGWTTEKVTVEMTPEEAEKLRRACYFNRTIQDRISAGNGGQAVRDGWSMYHFLNDLGNTLKGSGIKRWKR